jgi:hypothetical protein
MSFDEDTVEVTEEAPKRTNRTNLAQLAHLGAGERHVEQAMALIKYLRSNDAKRVKLIRACTPEALEVAAKQVDVSLPEAAE